MPEKEKQLGLGTVATEGVFSTVFLNLSTPFLITFAVLYGANNFELGLLVSALAFFNLVGQIPSAKLVEIKGKRKLIASASSLISKTAWLGIIVAPILLPEYWFPAILAFVVCYSLFLGFTTPAWASWMGDLVEEHNRGRFFGKRNRIIGIASLSTLAFSALFLGFSPMPQILSLQVMFFLAVLFGVISFYFMTKTHEPEYLKPVKPESIPESLALFLKNKNFKRFIAFYFVWNLGIGIAAPFWDAFILNDLGGETFWIPLVAFALGLGGVLSLKYWGPIADKHGNRVVLIISAIGISLIPLAWIFVFHPLHGFLIDLVGGIFWGGFSLAVFTYQLDITPADRRPRYLAILGTITGIPLVFSAFLGGILASIMQGSGFFFISGLKFIFLLSFALRISSVMLLKGIDEPRVKRVSSKIVFMDIVGGRLSLMQSALHEAVFLKSKGTLFSVSKKMRVTLLAEVKRLSELRKLLSKMMPLAGTSKKRLLALKSVKSAIDLEMGKLRGIEKGLHLLEQKAVLGKIDKIRFRALSERVLSRRASINHIKEIIEISEENHKQTKLALSKT